MDQGVRPGIHDQEMTNKGRNATRRGTTVLEDGPALTNPSAADEATQILPASPVLSSRERAWRGIDVMLFRETFDEHAAPPLSNHLIVVNLGHRQNIVQRLDGRVYEGRTNKGDATIVPAGLPSEWHWREREENDVLHMYLEPAFLREVVAGSGHADPVGIEIVNALGARDPLIEQIGTSLLSELQAEGLEGRLYAESLANVLAVHLLRHHSSLGRGAVREHAGGLSRSALRLAIDYINDNLARNFTLDEISGAVNMSPYHFSRLFKRSTGLAPHQYVIRQRVEKAKRLLKETEAPLYEIARLCGFTDQSHLARHFKRLVGVTPSSLR